MYPPSQPFTIDNSIGLGDFGSTATVATLQKALTEVSRWMQRGEYNPGRIDGTVDIWTANAVLNVIADALEEIPGFKDLISGLGPAWDLLTSRAGIVAAWLAFEGQIISAINHLANGLAPILTGIVEVLMRMRRLMDNFEAKLSIKDIVRAAKYALGLLDEPPAPSELVAEEPEEEPTPRFPWQRGPAYAPPGGKPRAPIPVKPREEFPPGSFALYDPMKKSYHVLVPS